MNKEINCIYIGPPITRTLFSQEDLNYGMTGRASAAEQDNAELKFRVDGDLLWAWIAVRRKDLYFPSLDQAKH